MRIILTCFLFLYSFLVYSADTIKMVVDGRSQQFQVTLPANPTTGYQWTVKQYDNSTIKLVSSEYLAPKTKLMGAGGEMTFTFSRVKGAKYPKSMTLVFRYARSWEHGSGMMKKVLVRFK